MHTCGLPRYDDPAALARPWAIGGAVRLLVAALLPSAFTLTLLAIVLGWVVL